MPNARGTPDDMPDAIAGDAFEPPLMPPRRFQPGARLGDYFGSGCHPFFSRIFTTP